MAAATATTNSPVPRTTASAWNIRHVSPRKPIQDSSASARSNVSEVLPPLSDQDSWPDVCDNLARGRIPTQTAAVDTQSGSSSMSPGRCAASRSKKRMIICRRHRCLPPFTRTSFTEKWVQIAPAELQAAADAAAAAVRQPQQRRNGHQRSMSAGGARGGQATGHRPAQAPQLVPPVPPLPAPAGPHIPSSLDDVFVVRTQPHIHASSASISSSASATASTRGSAAGTHSTRATSPSSSLASLPPASVTGADCTEKASPSVALAQLHAPHDRRDPSLNDHALVALHSGVATTTHSGRVVFGSVEESGLVPSDDALPAFDLLAMQLNRPPPMRPAAGPTMAQSRRSSDELVPKLSALAINRGSTSISTGSTGSGSARGDGDSSPALSARTGTSLSFFADNPLEPGQLPRTPLEPAFELPPVTPWTPHSIGQVTPPGASQHEQGQPWKQHKQRSSSSSSLHSHYSHPQQPQWDLTASREATSDKRTASRRDRDHGKDRDVNADTGDLNVFEVDYSRRPRHQEVPPAPREPDVFVPRRDRERDGVSRYGNSRTRDGTDMAPPAARGRRNSFARGGGRGGGARSHSQPFDALTTSPAASVVSERGGRGRGRGGYRGPHREHANRDVGEGLYEHRRPPSPDSTHTSTFWDSGTIMTAGSTRVNFNESLPLPIPRTVVRVGDGGIVTPTQYFVLGQLEFYFSARNLQRDAFMRQQVRHVLAHVLQVDEFSFQMDSRGWVPLSLVASFKRLHSLTGGSMPLLRDVIALSEVVETNGDYIRLRDSAWGPWVLPGAATSLVDEEQPPVIDSGLPDIEIIEGRRPVTAEEIRMDSDDDEDEDSDDDIVFVMSAVD